MTKILGIDTGTNSLGWALVEKNGENYRLLDKGVNIFQEGVNIDKGNVESSKAAERTLHRAARVRNYRVKLRKIALLRVLNDNHLCPPLTSEELSAWRKKKVYPANELFMQWQRTDDDAGKNPYAYRHKCLHEKLDLDNVTDRYILGRALYHIAQRRGFLSNRKDQSSDETGKVKESIGKLTEDMNNAGFQYLGDYFYHLYNQGEKIRNHYTARNGHYLKEVRVICEKQGLDAALAADIENAIFFQRPLKSQKGQVGKCVFEPKKAKCSASHPLYEEFRMLAFVNNIKIRTPKDGEMRPLNAEERNSIVPLFYRKSKKTFDFEDIAKKLAPKKQYGFAKKSADAEMPYLFNYAMDTPVSGCPVTAALRDIFGDDWVNAAAETYTLGENKSRFDIINDIWHALFFYSDGDKLAEFAKKRLQLNDEEAVKFSKINLPSTYAALSLKAIRKILPYLRRGLIYSHAVFLGNLCEVMPAYEWGVKEMREAAIDRIVDAINRYDTHDERTLETCLKEYLKERYHIDEEKLKKLYHPSMIEFYPRVRPNQDGVYQLGSPRINSVRNPMAMRSLFRLRKLVNRLLEEGRIDPETEIHIEFARELNDANKREALKRYGRENQKKREEYRKSIVELYQKETGVTVEPTDTDILKYELWEEQRHVCLYTGQKINLADFIGSNPKFDIEHTIPRSVGGDSTKMNLTLCDSRFNREVKKTKLPTELANHDEIVVRIAEWKENYETLCQQINRTKKQSKGATTKEQKDNIIKKRRYLELKCDYWRGKYEQINATLPLLNELVKNHVAVVLCDNRMMPTAMLQTLDANTTQAESIKHQLAASEPMKKQAWKQIIEAKIRNQAAVLNSCGCTGGLLKPFYTNVKSGDTDNREGVAAKLYWGELFGDWFRRDREGMPPNNLLNYGYSILRAATARALLSSGLLPNLGIFHKSRYNAFPLADDIMEPYRPYVDIIVSTLVNEGMMGLNKDSKSALLRLLTCDVTIGKVMRPLQIALTFTAASLAKYYAGENKKLSLPNMMI